jgi:hypothetical protein
LLIFSKIRYLICLTIGPAFLSASIYLSLSRIVYIYSVSASRLRPRHYTYIFISCDLVSLILQGVGGGIAATGVSDQNQLNVGTDIMIAGLSFQVFSLLLFMALCADFALRIRKLRESEKNEQYESIRRTRLFRGFLFGMLAVVWSNHSCNATSNSSTQNSSGCFHALRIHSMLLSSRRAPGRLWRSLGQQRSHLRSLGRANDNGCRDRAHRVPPGPVLRRDVG